MDKAPLIVDCEMPVDELSERAINYGEKILKDGYIISEKGLYRGIGTGFDLLSTLSELQTAKNHIIMESINYASVIQRSFMRRSDEDLAICLNDYFLWWEPRDVVGGDCYYFQRYGEDGLFFALIDCTGHGVPGAFMTLIVMSALESALETLSPTDPAALLGDVNMRIKANLGQEAASLKNNAEAQGVYINRSDDGFDGGFGWYSKKHNQVIFAGAKTAMLAFHVGAAGVETVDGERMGVGYLSTPDNFVWKNQTLSATPGTRLYLTTDGIIDQIGGAKNIAFGKKRLREIIRMISYEPMQQQKTILQDKYREYQGENSRRDDVSIFGFRV
jgi:serine phosphatase RsbU (regulator of sigma subunit)